MWDLAAPFISSANAGGVGGPVFKQWTNAAPNRGPDVVLLPVLLAGGARTADQEGDGGSPPAGSAHAGSEDYDVATGAAQDWFERVHILPKDKVNFGNIITTVEEVYEIYSAFRESQETENAIINNALPGVDMPDNTPPVDFPRLTSLLDPSTTGQTTGALGTMVKSKIRALTNGLPTFDADVIFQFLPPANDVVLLVAGQRIVLIPHEYEAEPRETLAFMTNVIPSVDGHEQRIATRKQPRQNFRVEYKLDDVERQRIHALLFDWMANTFGLPLWHERLLLTASASVGATQFQVSGADDVDLRVGSFVAVITDSITFDVLKVNAATDVLITVDSSAVNAYPVGTAIMPVRTAIVPHRVRLQREVVALERFGVTFEVLDNDTGAPAGDVAPGFWSTHNGRVLFDDCNVVNGKTSGSLLRRIHVVDGRTGKIDVSSTWDRSKRASEKGFFARDRAEILSLRKLFVGLRGRQKAFYIPTFAEELTLNAPLSIGGDTMDIESVGYVRFVRDRLPMSLFRITFTDDTSIVKAVTSSAEVSGSVERLTLAAPTWPANRTVDEVRRIEWYELVRFDSDKMTLRYPRIAQARTKMPLIRVFDDDA